MSFDCRSYNSKCSLWMVVVWVGAAALEGLWAPFVLPTSLTFQPSFFHNLLTLVIHSFSCGSKDTLIIPAPYTDCGPLAFVCVWHGDRGVWCCVRAAIWRHPLPSVLSFHGQCFMKSIRVYSVISMEIIIIYYICFACSSLFSV